LVLITHRLVFILNLTLVYNFKVPTYSYYMNIWPEGFRCA